MSLFAALVLEPRINRRAFWRGLLLTYLAQLAATAFLVLVLWAGSEVFDYALRPALSVIIPATALVFSIAVARLCARRFQDAGWPGRLAFAGVAASVLLSMRWGGAVPDSVPIAAYWGLVVFCGLIPGQNGPNRFGPPPRDRRPDFPPASRELFEAAEPAGTETARQTAA